LIIPDTLTGFPPIEVFKHDSLEFPLVNLGFAPVEYQLALDQGNGFTIDSPMDGELYFGDTTWVQIGFSPALEGDYADTLRIFSNSGNHVLALAGQATIGSVVNYVQGAESVDLPVWPIYRDTTLVTTLQNTSRSYIDLAITHRPQGAFNLRGYPDDSLRLVPVSSLNLEIETFNEQTGIIADSLVMEAGDGGRIVVNLTSTFQHDFRPQLYDISDVPNDQGHRVQLSFWPSVLETQMRIREYHVYKSQSWNNQDTVWVFDSILPPGFGNEPHQVDVTLEADSSAVSLHAALFQIEAWETNGRHHNSSIRSGYSIDNLAPDSPGWVSIAQDSAGYTLNWPRVVASHGVHEINTVKYMLQVATSPYADEWNRKVVSDTTWFVPTSRLGNPLFFRVSSTDSY